jgi:hypothetical protein
MQYKCDSKKNNDKENLLAYLDILHIVILLCIVLLLDDT